MKKKIINPQKTIQEIAEEYPEVIETLIVEYGFHCVGCFVSEFETLEEGARVHGIEGEYFKELLDTLEKVTETSK